MRRMVLALTIAAAILAVVPAAAAADATFSGSANTPEGKLHLVVNVNKFTATAAGTQASGTATATLTPIGQLVLAAVVRPLARNRFTLETSKPHVEVSWQVTGVRHDAYARAHPLRVEMVK